MAINVSFNGATIYKPGAYSKINIDLSGGFPLGPVGLIAIFGESTKGKPGSKEADISRNVFTANDLTEVRNKYGSGPIVDAMSFLFAPASDGAIPGGAQAVYIYKTNESTQAELALANSQGTVKALEYGVGGNTITFSASTIAEYGPRKDGDLVDLTANPVPAGASLTFVEDGKEPNVFTMPSSQNTLMGVITALGTDANWSLGHMPVNYGMYHSGTDAAARFIIRNSDAVGSHRRGFGKSFEVKDGTTPMLALIGHVEGVTYSSVEAAQLIKVKQTRDLITEEETVGGNITLLGRYTGAEAIAEVEITATQIKVKTGAAVAIFDKSAYSTLLQLVNAINLIPGWEVEVASMLYNSLPLSVLDHGTFGAKALDAAAMPLRIKKSASEIRDFFAESSLVSITSTMTAGLFDEVAEVALAGGTLGGTSTASIVAALAAFQEIRVNSVIPLMSRDASADIVDNLTDAASNYTLLGIHQAIKTHCALMSTTKNRSERQGYLSMKASFDDCLDRAALLADARLQLAIQDVRNIDSQGAIRWFQPWAQACMIAGARAGSPVGTPLTFKFFNATGIRHTAQAMSTPEEDIMIDFNPNAQFEKAIRGGITFFEAPQSGGIRCVVDNTTYSKDGNWVYNRGNVLYAADVLAFDFRNQMENIYIGQKNTVKASEVKSVAASILNTYLAQGITVATDEAPNGYKKIDVSINGNVINIAVIVVLVEGIDFVLADITITRVQSEA